MNSIISPWVFYWIGIFNAVGVVAFLCAIVTAFGTFCFGSVASNNYDAREHSNAVKWAKRFAVGLVISLALCVLIPSEETCYKMLAAKMFTPNNINSATDYVTDVIDYAVDKVKELNPGSSSESNGG